jgi:ABC-type glycerol-3-phosphate transport system substrate-binding protein
MKQISRREFLRLAAATLGTGALAACVAPAAPPPAAPAEEAKPAATPAAEAGLEGKEGVLWGLKYDPHVEGYNRLAALFKEKTGAILKVEPQDWPLETKFAAALAAGTQPDVACIMGKRLPSLQIQNALLVVDDVVFKANGTDYKKVYYPDAWQAYYFQGKMWGVPGEVGGIGNGVNVPIKDLEALGLDKNYPPGNGNWIFESYEQLWECAKKLQVEEGGRVKKWGITRQGWENSGYLGVLDTIYKPQGKRWWDEENEKFNIDTPEGVQAMDYFVTKPVEMGIETQLDVNSVDACMSGRVAIGIGNLTPVLLGEPQGFYYEAAEIPPINPNNDYVVESEGGWGFVAPRKSNNPDISVAFLRFFDSYDAMLVWEKNYGGKKSGYIPLKGKFDHFLDPMGKNVRLYKWFEDNKIGERAVYFGAGSGDYDAVGLMISDATSKIRQKQMTSAEAVKVIQAGAEAQLKQYKDALKQAAGG